MEVKKIVFDHNLTLIGPYTSLQGVFQGPLWYYLLAIPLALFQGDPWGTILLMVGISMSVLIVVYFWMKSLFGALPALVTLFLFAVSPEAISAATYSWNPHPMWLLMVIYLFSFYELIQGKKRFNLIVWPTISIMFHFETALGVFVLTTSLIYFVLLRKKNALTKEFLLGISIGFLFFIPQIVFDLRNDFLMLRSVARLFMGSDQGLFVTNEKVPYLSLIAWHIDALLLNYRSSFPILSYFPTLWRVFFVLGLGFLAISLTSKNTLGRMQSFLIYLAGIFGVFFALTFVYPFPLRYWFLTGVQSVHILFISVVIAWMLRFRIGKLVVGLLFMVYFINALITIQQTFSRNDYGGTAKLRGKLDAVEYIYNDANSSEFGLLVFTPPVYTDAYDYLIWWKGSRTSGYIPHTEKRGIVYLLMEPDPHQPWSYKGWMETVVKTGQPLKTVTLPSGIIIQKRHYETNSIGQ